MIFRGGSTESAPQEYLQELNSFRSYAAQPKLGKS